MIGVALYLLIAWAWWLGYPCSDWRAVAASLLWPATVLTETRELWRDNWTREGE